MNRVILVGNLGADPEVRNTQSGTTVMRLRVATNERFKDSDGSWQSRAEWHTVILFGKRAEGLQKADPMKGTKVAVEGSIRTRSYEDKEGNKRSNTEIIAGDVELLGGPKPRQREEPEGDPFGDDNLPW